MTYVTFTFADHDFQVYPCGAVYWPTRETVIVSDLHLEKGSCFAANGQFLPPYDTAETLEKLEKVCAVTEPKAIVFLGDIFHDKTSLDRMSKDDRSRFSRLLNSYKIIWIEGNHDEGHVMPGINALAYYREEGITFRHIALPQSVNDPEISGHYHPAIKIQHKGVKIRRPCLAYSSKKMIIPSYGVFTGGLDVDHPALKKLIYPNPRFIALGRKKAYLFN